MLTNTVGIMVFILIFTVLTAGAVVFAKRLPMERERHVPGRQYFVCANNRIYPLRRATVNALIGKGNKKWGSVASRVEEEDQDVHYCLNVSAGGTVVCEPKPGMGTAPRDVARAGSVAGGILAGLKPEETGVMFWVKPDSVPAFLAARDYAVQLGFACTWSAEEKGEPITFSLGGGSDNFKGQN